MEVNVSFQSNVAAVQKKVDDQIVKVLMAIGGMGESYAKQLCPVDTGNLRNSITHVVEDDTVIIGTNVTYAPYVEFGTGIYAEGGGGRQTPWYFQDSHGEWHRTSGMRPRPYLRPAIENHIEDFKHAFDQISV